jgi:predicted DNA-binding transcriptional regulator YafY
VFYQSSLYIIAAASEVPADQERIRHLKLDRFVKATALDRWFELPADFDIDEYLAQGVGIFSGSGAAGGKAQDFRIRISPRAARWLTEDPWHPNQQIQPQRDGSLLLTVTAAHELEIIPRVLALGSEAELLAPASCRAALAATVRQLAERYRDD